MPVTTRSQTRGLSVPGNAEPRPSRNLRRAKRTLPSAQGPRKRFPIDQSWDQKKQALIDISLSSLERSNPTLTHWPCQSCPCPRGAFRYPIDKCIRCGHTMGNHEDVQHRWNPGCDFVCERTDLVTSILQLARNTRVVVIRATPQVGKTTLLRLLGRHILYKESELEPVFIEWKDRRLRNGLPYEQYLEQKRLRWQKDNAKYRPHNPKATTAYLVDEAQNSYEEEHFWTRTLKCYDARQQSIFVLVCPYGAAGLSSKSEPDIISQALLVDCMQRVELRPSKIGCPYMLFRQQETDEIVQKWAIVNKFQLKAGVSEYLHAATDGHPGMIGLILKYFEFLSSQLPKRTRRTRVWSPRLCHENIVESDELLDFMKSGRGLWTLEAETHVKECLGHPFYSSITFSEVAKVLREVAMKPNGHTRVQLDFDAFAFCYKMGFLHSEQQRPESDEVVYIFASPIHRRIAYRRLFPGPEPGTNLQETSLQQICLNAIGRFSPSIIQLRNRRSIPEAAFQDELYYCLTYELQSLPILSECLHTKDGRVDFYVFNKKWGVKVLQSRSKVDITEHICRFQSGGKYQEWTILDDYVILNFCPKTALQEIEIEDVGIQPRFLQIAIDPEECTAEVYTHDKQLRVTLDLGEGRQRYYADDFELSKDPAQILQDQLTRAERACQDMILKNEDMAREKEDMMREKEDMMRRIAELENLKK